MTATTMTQAELDRANAAFWNEVCGTSLARRIRPRTIKAFDKAYLGLYPWLTEMIQTAVNPGDHVLEIGPGYGTVGRLIVARRADYWALDIAPNVIAHTLAHTTPNAVEGNVLALNERFAPGSFDVVIAIGSLHHTGNLPLALEQVNRVLRAGGLVVAMVYGDGNTHDYRLDGTAAPHTDITPPDEIPALFAAYRDLQIELRGPHDHVDVYVSARK